MRTYPPFGERGGRLQLERSRIQRPVCTFHFHHFPPILGSTGRGMKSSRKALWPTITDRTHIIHLDQWAGGRHWLGPAGLKSGLQPPKVGQPNLSETRQPCQMPTATRALCPGTLRPGLWPIVVRHWYLLVL